MNEKSLERKLRESVRCAGGLALKIWSVSFTGLPDRLVLMPGGRACFAEIKSPGMKPTKKQRAIHGILQSLGFMVAVIDGPETLKLFLEAVTKC